MTGFPQIYGRRLVDYDCDIERQGQACDQYQYGDCVSVHERAEGIDEETGFICWRQTTSLLGRNHDLDENRIPKGYPLRIVGLPRAAVRTRFRRGDELDADDGLGPGTSRV